MSNSPKSKIPSLALAAISVIAVLALALLATQLVSRIGLYQPSYEAERGADTQDGAAELSTPRVALDEATDEHQTQPRQEHEQTDWWGVPADGWVAIFTLVLGVATILLWLATREAIRDARLSSEREQRAYVFPHSVDLLDGATQDPPLPGMANNPGAHIVLKNTGSTPAYNVVHWAEIKILDRVNESTLELPLEVKGVRSVGWMGRDGLMNKTAILGRILTMEEVDAIRTGGKAIFLHGWIDYTDAFKRQRRTTYRLMYWGVYPATGGIFTFCQNGNEAT